MHTIQYTANPNSATTDKKVRNVSACLYGDFRQVGGVDIYKFSVLLLFCMDFRVGCLLLCCCYMYNMYFFCVRASIVWIFALRLYYFRTLSIRARIPNRPQKYEDEKLLHGNGRAIERKRRKKGIRKFCVVICVCVYAS